MEINVDYEEACRIVKGLWCIAHEDSSDGFPESAQKYRQLATRLESELNAESA